MIYLPNLLTLARIAMVPWLVVLLQNQQYVWSLGVFLIAGVTDGLDGYIAKRFNAKTELGAVLDPLADKALLVTSFVMLSVLNIVPFWLMVVVVFRDVVIVGGYLVMVNFFGSVRMNPLFVSKFNTFLQIAYVLCVLASLAVGFELGVWLNVLNYWVLVTAIISGVAYVSIWSIKATTMTDGRIE